MDEILRAEYSRAKGLLDANLNTMITLAEALKEERRLDAERLRSLLSGLSAREAPTNLADVRLTNRGQSSGTVGADYFLPVSLPLSPFFERK
ncbi:hypothetical protein LJR010_001783 [Ensifer adhaerens]|uniref:hypothetical protein n=1 Tax=Ensifer adhaerens TaxID=106592 RepID=UPI00399BFF2E